MKTRTRIGFVYLVSLIIAACGGGGGGGGNPPPVQQQPPPQSPYLAVSGEISAPVGTNVTDLKVVALGQESSPNAQGAYRTEVHPQGLSLILATENGRSFGLARIFVAGGAVDTAAAPIDTTSTAVSLVFISPFVFVADPTEAEALLAIIEEDPTIPAFAQAIEAAWGDADPFENVDLLATWQTTQASVADTIGTISSTPSEALSQAAIVQAATIRLPKRSQPQQNAAAMAPSQRHDIDTQFTRINVISSGNQYLLQADSEFNNAIDWWVEVGHVDHSHFRFAHELQAAIAEPAYVYPRVGSPDSWIGVDVNRAKGVLRLLEPVKLALNWLIDSIQNAAYPDGIPVDANQDALYIVRAFSGSPVFNQEERTFVQTLVPNGALNEKHARGMNYVSSAFDVLGLVLDITPLLDDTFLTPCLKSAVIEAFVETLNFPPDPETVRDIIALSIEVGQPIVAQWAECAVSEGAIATATGAGWINDAWSALLGYANVPIFLAQSAERYTFLVATATPLESVLVEVGTPVEPDTEAPTAPSGLTAIAVSTSDVGLEWEASSDNDAVAEYLFYRDGELAGSTTTLSFVDRDRAANTTYCYQIEAYDYAGNPSSLSTLACATTLAAGTTVVLESIVNPQMPIPGSDRYFSYIGEAVIDNDRIAFRGGAVNFGVDGLYILERNGDLATIRGYGEGQTESKVRLDGDRIYFAVGNTYYIRDSGQTLVVLDADDPPPRPGPEPTIGRIKEVIAENGNLAFITSHGVFADVNNTRYWIAETSMVPPGAANTFWATGFRGLGFDGNRVAFRGFSSNITGLYDWIGGPLGEIDSGSGSIEFDYAAVSGARVVYEYYSLDTDHQIVQCNDADCIVALDGSGNNPYGVVPRVLSLFLSGDRVAFHEHHNETNQGIYVLENGALTEVFHISDTLDGRSVQSVELVGFEGDTLLLIVRWTPGYSDLYKATLSVN